MTGLAFRGRALGFLDLGVLVRMGLLGPVSVVGSPEESETTDLTWPNDISLSHAISKEMLDAH